MIEKFCLFLTNKIRKENPEIDDERAEVINYGLQLIIGEVPKMLITIAVAYCLGILKLTLFMILIIMPYRAVSGGFHLKTHIGCIITTTLFYCGIPEISKYIHFNSQTKIVFVLCALIFGIIIINFMFQQIQRMFLFCKKKKENRKKYYHI